MSETTKNRLYLMITITNRVMGATHFLDFYRAFGAPVVFTALTGHRQQRRAELSGSGGYGSP